MRKFSKIIESKEEMLSRISITDDDIEDMLTDLTDIGYSVYTDAIYISQPKLGNNIIERYQVSIIQASK